MRYLLAISLVLIVACGHEIGDSCTISSECSAQGDRICDISQHQGYCTIIGCEFGTCPDEAVCVRFFPLGNSSIGCDPLTEDVDTDDCSQDELCTLAGHCAPRTSEVRYCMKMCDGDGDCREEYECRGLEDMIAHGGEPVPPVGEPVSDNPQAFCAVAPL